MTYKHIQKVIDWGVKIASIAITGPATWIVAGQLFYDIQSPALLFFMKFAAVFLIEGVLFSNWLLLEFDKNASPEIKARYAITALVMYIMLAIIGWQHEGAVGLVFRVALLAALIGSGWDTYVYTWEKATQSVDRSVENAGRVKRHARRMAIKEALAARKAEHALIMAQQEAESKISQARIGVEHEVALEGVNLYGDRQRAEIHLDHQEKQMQLAKQERKLLGAINSAPTPTGNGNGNGTNDSAKKNAAIIPPIVKVGDSPRISALTDKQLLVHTILDEVADNPRITRTALATKTGKDTKEVKRLIDEMIEDGLLYKDGRQLYLIDESGEVMDYAPTR